MIVMPAMGAAQEAAWMGLFDLYEQHPDGWTLIGGQMVHLLCAERGYAPQRPTEDADAVVDARVPAILGSVTTTLVSLGFDSGTPSANEIQHRWTKGPAALDVLIPEGTGEKAEKRPSASGFPTIAAPGGTQALARSEIVDVQVSDRVGRIPRPPLVSAMIMKSAARIETTGPARERHCHDFATLAAMMASGDAALEMTPKDRQRLRKMTALTLALPEALDRNPRAKRRLARLAEIIDA